MTVDDWLRHASQQLVLAGIATARLDCLVLLEDILNTNRTQILAHPERTLTEVEAQKLQAMVDKRAKHVPLAYLRGKTEFYGREFTINEDVLEPRPESETMIELLKQLPQQPRTIIDVGTGSGALAITAKLELFKPDVYAIDIDQKCLQVAKRNAKQLDTDITFLSGNLLEPLPEPSLNTPVALLCNLPYVPDNFEINTAALHEPRLAIFGGPDGLDSYRQLFASRFFRAMRPAYVLTEAMPPQHGALIDIARQQDYRCTRHEDFIQLFEPAT